jgi:hypothetical protein
VLEALSQRVAKTEGSGARLEWRVLAEVDSAAWAVTGDFFSTEGRARSLSEVRSQKRSCGKGQREFASAPPIRRVDTCRLPGYPKGRTQVSHALCSGVFVAPRIRRSRPRAGP